MIRAEKDGAAILKKGYGLANREEGRAFDPSTVVQIGSNTKDFTMVALLQLQERGRIDMRDSLAKYFPNAPADKRGITLAQLANHRAGFPIGLGGDFEPLSRDQFLDAAFKRPLSYLGFARAVLEHRIRAPRRGDRESERRHVKISGLDQIEASTVEISIVTANEGAATMKVPLDNSSPPRIKGIQMMVGG